MWDAARGRALVRLEGHAWTVTSVAFAPDGTRVATGSEDNTTIIWNDLGLETRPPTQIRKLVEAATPYRYRDGELVDVTRPGLPDAQPSQPPPAKTDPDGDRQKTKHGSRQP